MAELIVVHPEVFNALAFGQTHPGTLSFLSSLPNMATDRLTHAAQGFYQQSQTMISSIMDSSIVRQAEAVLRKVAHSWDLNVIRELNDLGSLQYAPQTMMRWIMAEPTVRHLYHRQEVHGYGEQYLDREPDFVGEQHYDYRRVMDGIVQVTPEGEEVVKFYIDDVAEGDWLNITEKTAVTLTWAELRHQLELGRSDPTSPFNSALT